MNQTTEYLANNIERLTEGAALLENIAFDEESLEDAIQTGFSPSLSSSDNLKIANFVQALNFLTENCRYPLELGTLLEYNSIVGDRDDAHPNPGYVRQDREVRISGCAYTAPPVSMDEALGIVNAYRDYADILDQIAYLALVLPKSQLFYDGNKRTTLLACNHLLCYYAAGMLFDIGDLGRCREYVSLLLEFYSGDLSLRDAMSCVREFLA